MRKRRIHDVDSPCGMAVSLVQNFLLDPRPLRQRGYATRAVPPGGPEKGPSRRRQRIRTHWFAVSGLDPGLVPQLFVHAIEDHRTLPSAQRPEMVFSGRRVVDSVRQGKNTLSRWPFGQPSCRTSRFTGPGPWTFHLISRASPAPVQPIVQVSRWRGGFGWTPGSGAVGIGRLLAFWCHAGHSTPDRGGFARAMSARYVRGCWFRSTGPWHVVPLILTDPFAPRLPPPSEKASPCRPSPGKWSRTCSWLAANKEPGKPTSALSGSSPSGSKNPRTKLAKTISDGTCFTSRTISSGSRTRSKSPTPD